MTPSGQSGKSNLLRTVERAAAQRSELSPGRVCEPWVKDSLLTMSCEAANAKNGAIEMFVDESPLRGSKTFLRYPGLADSPGA